MTATKYECGVMEPNYLLQAAVRRCTACPNMMAVRFPNGVNGSEEAYAVPAEVGVNCPDHPLAIMCEAPGAQEAATSRPLQGPAGRIFNELLAEAGLRRDELILMNRVRCRPPENKLKLAPEGMPNCEHWVEEELAAYDPPVVILMGGTALSAVFGSTAKVGAVRGQSRSSGIFGDTARVYLATYHPASLLPYRSPWNRQLVIDDLMSAEQTRREILSCGA